METPLRAGRGCKARDVLLPSFLPHDAGASALVMPELLAICEEMLDATTAAAGRRNLVLLSCLLPCSAILATCEDIKGDLRKPTICTRTKNTKLLRFLRAPLFSFILLESVGWSPLTTHTLKTMQLPNILNAMLTLQQPPHG